jgi:molybdate transport system substrate-binding protein
MWPWLFLWLFGGPPAKPPLLVSAAVSLTEALTECGAAFTASTGIPVRLNFGASNALARQIVQGAPVDLFVSADDAQMRFVEHQGSVVPGSQAVVASNRLVIIVPGPGSARWTSAAPLVGPSIRRIAIGDPAAVPAGVYAKRWLQRIGLWIAAEPKLVPAATVRGALSAVRTGAADAGIVYRTDARADEDTAVVFEVIGPDAPPIEYPAAVVRQSRRAADARLFLEFLRGPVAQEIFRRRGFDPPASPSTR